MINVPINKILFLDIETVGLCKDWSTCQESNPKIAEQFVKYFEEEMQKMNDVYAKRTALVPEFAKIVCVSVAFVMENGEIKKQSFSGDNEHDLLMEVRTLLDRCSKLDFYLCGHNLKNFDIPMLAKRMIINGIRPSKMLPSYDTKPWEIKAIDTKDVWQYGAYSAIGSLDLMCACLDIPTPKDGPINGGMVHEAYWSGGRLNEIVEYCEKDVDVLINAILQLKSLK